LAIAASDLPEIKKVVSELQSGVLFDPDSPRSISKAIQELAGHPKKIMDFKRNSLKKAKEYSWENQEKKQLEMYAKIIAPKKKKSLHRPPR
jgi:glycosyltransferase involved in cell wall biosynthesis